MLSKPKLFWQSPHQRQQEWQVANLELRNDMGGLKPLGTKLSRKRLNLSRSYMVLNHQIWAMSRPGEGKIFGHGSTGYVKWGENESGGLLAIKIEPFRQIDEAQIAFDLGLAGLHVIRGHIKKLYIPYRYLGLSLKYFPRPQHVEQVLDLCIRITMKFHELHHGQYSRQRQGYLHRDVHFGNVLVDEHQHPHIIDFGFSVPNVADLAGQEVEENYQVTRLFYDECQLRRSEALLSPYFLNYEMQFYPDDYPKHYQFCIWGKIDTPGFWQYSFRDMDDQILYGELNDEELREGISKKINSSFERMEVNMLFRGIESSQELQKKWQWLQMEYGVNLFDVIYEKLVEKGIMRPKLAHLEPLNQFLNRPFLDFKQGPHQLIDIAFVLLMTRMQIDYRIYISFYQRLALPQKESFVVEMLAYNTDRCSEKEPELFSRMLRNPS
jgi:hypothetical protein